MHCGLLKTYVVDPCDRFDLDPKDHIDRKVLRFMGDSAAFGYIATDRAIADAGLSEELVTSLRTGLIMGSGGLSGEMFVEAVDVMRARGIKRAGPYRVTQIMASTVSLHCHSLQN